MVYDRSENANVAAKQQRDFTTIAMLVGIVIVAAGVFISYAASTNFTTTASYSVSANAPIAAPAIAR